MQVASCIFKLFSIAFETLISQWNNYNVNNIKIFVHNGAVAADNNSGDDDGAKQ